MLTVIIILQVTTLPKDPFKNKGVHFLEELVLVLRFLQIINPVKIQNL
jgi:hypothetical protein